MKTIKIFLFILFIMPSYAFNQDEDKSDFDKLEKLYEKMKYEDCAYKSEMLVNSDQYKKSPEPYIYLAMSLYRISEDESLQEMYPTAYKNAFKSAAKAVKYDENMSVVPEFEAFFSELKKAGIRDATVDFQDQKYSKVSNELNKLHKIFPTNNSILFSKGICEILSNNPYGGKEEITLAVNGLKTELAAGTYKKETTIEDMMAKLIITYCDHIEGSLVKLQEDLDYQKKINNESRIEELNNELTLMADSASKTLEFGKLLLPKNEVLAAGYGLATSEEQ